MSDGYEYEIPLHAYIPSPVIVFEPFINFGFVQVNTFKSQKILFRNEGIVEDDINLKTDNLSDITIDPQYFKILPGKSKMATITYHPQDAGIFRGTLEV